MELKKWKIGKFNFRLPKQGKRQERLPLYLENGSIYKPGVLVKYDNCLGGKISMYIIDYRKSYKINTIEDI